MHKAKKVFNYMICRKCYNAFTNKRALAYIIDMLAIYLVTMILAILILPAIDVQGGGERELRIAGRIINFCGILMLLLKDSFSGKSLGKKVLGIRVVDAQTNRPIGPGKSILRNLILLVPVMPLVEAFVLMQGQRLGDRIAKTRVVLDQYADSPVFLPQNPMS